MKILILGKGYIGNYLFKLNHSHNIKWISKLDLDYTDPKTLKLYLDNELNSSNQQFDWIINCSGYTGKPNVEACEFEKEKCYHYNVTVPLFLTKVANELNIPIIHIGSGCIYDGYSKIYNEDDIPNFGSDSYRSSFYSKTKDAFEKLSAHLNRYIFRIRIPFNEVPESKNYLSKIINYNNLISCKNSITNINDLASFIYKFIEQKRDYGIYNIVNEGHIEAKEVTELLEKYSIKNLNWNFISVDDIKFKVNRSNCILDTSKIKKFNLQLPPVINSLERDINIYSKLLSKINKYDPSENYFKS
jgi:dTDP-4-dehydrorhamnose reductase